MPLPYILSSNQYFSNTLDFDYKLVTYKKDWFSNINAVLKISKESRFHENKTNSDMVEAFSKRKLVLQKHSSLGMFFNTAGGKRIKLDDSQ